MNKYLTRNRKGSALLIALVVLVILTIMSTVFIERLLSFSKSSEGIENSNIAYYNALGSIETALFTGGVNKYTPWNIANSSVGTDSITGSLLNVLTGGTSIPASGFGNSPYDPSWNIISLGSPVQLVIPDGIIWSNVNFYFRIPQTDSTQTSTGIDTMSLGSSGIILWILTSTGNTLFASGETSVFLGSEIDGTSKKISGKDGITNTGSLQNFASFYTNVNGLGVNGANCAGYQCTLKLSMIRPVATSANPNTEIPFLEYKIDGINTMIPQQYMHIQADGYAYGFMRSRTLDLPQITTNNTLDFAVVQ